MKTFYFIDNDRQKDETFDDVGRVKDVLEKANILFQDIKEVYDFGSLERNDVYNILFNPDNVICTWSVYSAGPPYSLQQLLSFLKAAGRSRISKVIYIDCSGMLTDTLNRHLDNEQKHVMSALQAIENNFIITRTDEGPKRIRISLEGFDSVVKHEDIDINLLLK